MTPFVDGIYVDDEDDVQPETRPDPKVKDLASGVTQRLSVAAKTGSSHGGRCKVKEIPCGESVFAAIRAGALVRALDEEESKGEKNDGD